MKRGKSVQVSEAEREERERKPNEHRVEYHVAEARKERGRHSAGTGAGSPTGPVGAVPFEVRKGLMSLPKRAEHHRH